ncbi:MAM domain-containing glycosylphosphatidylinositol anchor protein 1-like, partial [Tropilaelaps mercedesae]
RCGKLKDIEHGSYRMVTSNGQRLARFSCDSGYTLHGVATLACNRRRWIDPVPLCYAKTCEPLMPRPNVLFDPVPGGGLLQALRCYPGYIFFGSRTVFCDGQQWNASFPICKARYYDLPDTCTFENGDCHWGQDPENMFRWYRHSGETSTVGTGPSRDHTGLSDSAD